MCVLEIALLFLVCREMSYSDKSNPTRGGASGRRLSQDKRRLNGLLGFAAFVLIFTFTTMILLWVVEDWYRAFGNVYPCGHGFKVFPIYFSVATALNFLCFMYFACKRCNAES